MVIGGLSAEQTLKTVKLASTRYYDNLHTTWGRDLSIAFPPWNRRSCLLLANRLHVLPVHMQWQRAWASLS